MINKEDFSRDFAELESTSKNLKSAGSKLMEEFRKTRRFGNKTQGPWHSQLKHDDRPPCYGHFHDTHHGHSYSYIPNQKMQKILLKSEEINKQYSASYKTQSEAEAAEP